MGNDTTSSECRPKRAPRGGAPAGACGGAYGLAMIGAAVFYFHYVHSFWTGVLAICKAIVWPAMVTYKALEFLYR